MSDQEKFANMALLARRQRYAVEHNLTPPNSLDDPFDDSVFEELGQPDELEQETLPTAVVTRRRVTVTHSPENRVDADTAKYEGIRGLIFGTIQASPIRRVELPMFPALDGNVFVKIMDVDAKYMVDEAIRAQNHRASGMWRLFCPSVVAWCLIGSACDEDGDLIFTKADYKMLTDKKTDRRFLEAVWRESFDLNDMFDRAVKTTVKNSDETTSFSTSSDSPVSGDAQSEKSSDDSGEDGQEEN